MYCNTPGFPVQHQLPKLTQTHVHWVGDTIEPSHHLSLSSPSPPAFYLSQLQGLFQRVGSSHLAARILELQLQHQSFQWIFRVDFLSDWLVQTLAVQGTLKSLLQHHNLKISVLWCSAFFMIQLLLIRELVPIIWVRELYCAVLSHSVMPDSFLPHRL